MTLTALKAVSGLVPVPALQEATLLAIMFLEGVQVSRSLYILGLLRQQFSREPRTIKALMPNSPRMPANSF
jgi:hypothetical protein